VEIKFIAQNQHVMETRLKPVPAASALPQWWLDMPAYTKGDNTVKLNNGALNITGKKCMPLLDGITSGYIVPLWSDVYVEQINDKPVMRWITSYPVADTWAPGKSRGYDIPEGYSDVVFKYLHGWIPKTPKGYSCLITHPMGYNSLPIRTIPGVIDSDELDTEANSPFLLKEGFEGIIPKGTPMFQILPFKRDNWESSFDVYKDGEYNMNLERLKTKLVSYYGKMKRSNKVYK